VIVTGGTDYAPDATAGYRDPSLDPRKLARAKVLDAAEHSAATLLHTHVADHRRLFERMDVSLGTSTALQRGMDTWERIRARHTDDTPDPELE
ncbi:glycoside hydrolase family 95 protein, partial [Streptomyces scabiei]